MEVDVVGVELEGVVEDMLDGGNLLVVWWGGSKQ